MSRLDDLRQQLATAEAALAAHDEAHAPGPTDPGTHSMNAHRTDAQIGRSVQAAVNHYGRIHAQSVRLEQALEAAKRAVLAEEQRIRDEAAAHTLDQLPTAKAVRDRYGWHAVKQVNRKTVTVWDRDWSGKPVGRTIPINRIKEVKS